MLRICGITAVCVATSLVLAATLIVFGPDLEEALDGVWP